jgi:choline monooxygenase
MSRSRATETCESRAVEWSRGILFMQTDKEQIHIDPDIANAWTLPSRVYTDPAVLAFEKEKIFSRTWQVVAHSSRLANPGDFLTTDLAGEPLLLARGADGILRGFFNVCRHRAGPVADGCGSRKLFRCGYHGWTYALDGSLVSATEFEGVDGFRPEEFSLASFRVEEWFNLVFVNLDRQAQTLGHALGDFPKQAQKFPFAGMKLFERRTYDMKCNWKTYVDNYLEGYHLPTVHPGLNRELDFNAYSVEPYPNHVRQFSPIRGAQAGDITPRRYQASREDLTTDYFWIFPNWMLNCYPDNVSLNIVLPVEPERSLAIFEWYLPESAHASSAAKASVEFSHQIQIDDIAICETVQKNLRSKSYDRGRYSVTQEKGVHAFHRMYAQLMAVS